MLSTLSINKHFLKICRHLRYVMSFSEICGGATRVGPVYVRTVLSLSFRAFVVFGFLRLLGVVIPSSRQFPFRSSVVTGISTFTKRLFDFVRAD